jgi:hypothetical protein
MRHKFFVAFELGNYSGISRTFFIYYFYRQSVHTFDFQWPSFFSYFDFTAAHATRNDTSSWLSLSRRLDASSYSFHALLKADL